MPCSGSSYAASTSDPTVQALISQLSAAIEAKDWATILQTIIQLTMRGIGDWTGGAPGMGNYQITDQAGDLTTIDGSTGQVLSGPQDDEGQPTFGNGNGGGNGALAVSPVMLLAGAGLLFLALSR